MRLGVLVGGWCVGAALGIGAFAACTVQNGGGESVDAAAMEAAVGEDAPATESGPMDAAPGMDAGPRDTGATDGRVSEEAGRQDAAPCSGVLCNGKCLPDGDCHSCSGAPLLCGSAHTCTSACAGCLDTHGAAMPIECFACDSNHANPIGTCDYADAGSYCLSGDYLGQYEDGGPGYRCGCTDVSACPGATQVCVPLGNVDAGFCLTCGEVSVGQIQGQPCKDGGTCQASQALCQ